MDILAINNMNNFSTEELININGGSMLGTVGNLGMTLGASVFGAGMNIASTGVGAEAGAGTCFVGGIIFGAGAACSFIDSL